MNQSDLIAQIAEVAGVKKSEAEHVLKTAAAITHEALASGDEVVFPGLGKFTVSERAERTGRNPQSGESMIIPAKRLPKFNASKALKDAVA